MKHLIAVTLFFLSINSYSQTSVKSQPHSDIDLGQYMWSFSKNKAVSEKPLIDFDIMDNWRTLGDYLSVSNDGSYFAYSINKPADIGVWANTQDSLVIQDVHNNWRMPFAGSNQGFFSGDNKQYIFQDGETLCFLQLGGEQVRKIENVASYKVSQDKWLAYQLKDKDSLSLQDLLTGKEKQFAAAANFNFSNNGVWLICQGKDKQLTLYNLATGTERKFSSVETYSLAADGRGLLLKTSADDQKAMDFVELPDGDVKMVWSGTGKTDVGSYSIDASGKQVLFTVVENGDAANAGIWYYEEGMGKAVLKTSPKTLGLEAVLTINNLSFSDNGRYIQLFLHKMETPGNVNHDIAGLEVWNHKDLNLQSVQSYRLNQAASFQGIVNIETGKLVFMESNDKKLSHLKSDFALVNKDYNDLLGDRFWESGIYTDSTWIVSLKDGSSHLLPLRHGGDNCWFSPNGKYLVYFDKDRDSHYFSYDLYTGILTDISANVPENQLNLSNRERDSKADFGNLAGWLENDAGVLVYDDYDIWKLDLSGQKPASNVTGMLGRSNGIMFNMFASGRYNFGQVPVIKMNEPLLFRAFNVRNKQSGFYRKNNLNATSLEPLYMGGYFMRKIMGCHDPNLSNEGLAPVKAKAANTWIVQRQSANDAPNYYETNDFKDFRRLTNFQPQKNYQWFTEELVNYKNLDGTKGQGILYKPENFDPNKKYPVLIAVYGSFSNNMNQFPVPGYINHDVEPGQSPIWMVNNGYLVFTPDIFVAPLKFGPKAFSVMEGAVQYLKTLPYVDANKLGCTSHSWSGRIGAYLLTHSASFSATAMSEGFAYADLINTAFSVTEDGSDRLHDTEKGQGYGSLWENEASWLDQNTILQADKAKNPLLMYSNKQSSLRTQDETRRLFIALRRLDKNVWWLSYDKGSHDLFDHTELRDYTVRYTQFFDHYLKNAPAPLWMTKGIPLKLKGIESRYELDPQGTCNDANGEPCPICQAWNKQYKRTPEMFTKDIKDWVLDKDIADELDNTLKEKRKELDKEGLIRQQEVLQLLNAK